MCVCVCVCVCVRACNSFIHMIASGLFLNLMVYILTVLKIRIISNVPRMTLSLCILSLAEHLLINNIPVTSPEGRVVHSAGGQTDVRTLFRGDFTRVVGNKMAACSLPSPR